MGGVNGSVFGPPPGNRQGGGALNLAADGRAYNTVGERAAANRAFHDAAISEWRSAAPRAADYEKFSVGAVGSGQWVYGHHLAGATKNADGTVTVGGSATNYTLSADAYSAVYQRYTATDASYQRRVQQHIAEGKAKGFM